MDHKRARRNNRKDIIGSANFLAELATKNFSSGDCVQYLRSEELTMEYMVKSQFNYPIVISRPEGLGLELPQINDLKDLEALVGSECQVEIISSLDQSFKTMPFKQFVSYLNTEFDSRTNIYNMISCECSHLRLGSHIVPPKMARELDLTKKYWNEPLKGHYPKVPVSVEKFLLMGSKNSYTDFHIDFGGSSVWYHIVKGVKIFYLLKPTQEVFDAFWEWNNSRERKTTFFLDKINNGEANCFKCILTENSTLFLPSGWIHAVLTEEDSIVFGGNFLHLLQMPMQLKVNEYEIKFKVPLKQKYPHFKKMMWLTLSGLRPELCDFLQRRVAPPSYLLEAVDVLCKALSLWYKKEMAKNKPKFKFYNPEQLIDEVYAIYLKLLSIIPADWFEKSEEGEGQMVATSEKDQQSGQNQETNNKKKESSHVVEVHELEAVHSEEEEEESGPEQAAMYVERITMVEKLYLIRKRYTGHEEEEEEDEEGDNNREQEIVCTKKEGEDEEEEDSPEQQVHTEEEEEEEDSPEQQVHTEEEDSPEQQVHTEEEEEDSPEQQVHTEEEEEDESISRIELQPENSSGITRRASTRTKRRCSFKDFVVDFPHPTKAIKRNHVKKNSIQRENKVQNNNIEKRFVRLKTDLEVKLIKLPSSVYEYSKRGQSVLLKRVRDKATNAPSIDGMQPKIDNYLKCLLKRKNSVSSSERSCNRTDVSELDERLIIINPIVPKLLDKCTQAMDRMWDPNNFSGLIRLNHDKCIQHTAVQKQNTAVQTEGKQRDRSRSPLPKRRENCEMFARRKDIWSSDELPSNLDDTVVDLTRPRPSRQNGRMLPGYRVEDGSRPSRQNGRMLPGYRVEDGSGPSRHNGRMLPGYRVEDGSRPYNVNKGIERVYEDTAMKRRSSSRAVNMGEEDYQADDEDDDETPLGEREQKFSRKVNSISTNESEFNFDEPFQEEIWCECCACKPNIGFHRGRQLIPCTNVSKNIRNSRRRYEEQLTNRENNEHRRNIQRSPRVHNDETDMPSTSYCTQQHMRLVHR